jgi:hypothetical protein
MRFAQLVKTEYTFSCASLFTAYKSAKRWRKEAYGTFVQSVQFRFHNYMSSFSQSSENTCKNIFFIEMLRNFLQADECVYVMENII